jgi:hypothetical protein
MWKLEYVLSSVANSKAKKSTTNHWGSPICLICAILLAQMWRDHIWPVLDNKVNGGRWAAYTWQKDRICAATDGCSTANAGEYQKFSENLFIVCFDKNSFL